MLALVKNWGNHDTDNGTTLQVSASIRPDEVESLKMHGLDVNNRFESLLVNEFNQSLQKLILNEVCKNKEDIDYFYCVKDGNICFTEFEITTQLATKLYHDIVGYDFIITNGKIGSLLQDSLHFTIDKIVNHSINNPGYIYNIGMFGAVPLYIDPYMRYTDSDIYVGKKSIDFIWSTENCKIEEGQFLGKPNTSMVLNGSYKLDNNLTKTKHIIVIDDKDALAKHKAVIREIGIDKLFNI